MVIEAVAVKRLEKCHCPDIRDIRAGFGFSDKGISNGMDAPAFNGISCVRVEVSSNHSNQQERPR
jgi:hypothetical protein